MSQFSFAHLQANIKTNIFKFMRFPLNLALCNRGWSNVARDPHART
ncbi:10586_t:CDS:1, partial [Funneliformis mosseae]